MADSTYVCFDRLRMGLPHQHIVGRILRSYDAFKIRNTGEFLGITVLFIDEKSSVIHAFIPANQADRFRNLLVDGVIYTIKDFEVGPSNTHYKITEHPYVIRFLPNTTIVANDQFAQPIDEQKFMLRTFDQLNQRANTNIELPDVVGQVIYVEGSNLDDPTSPHRLVVRLKINVSQTISLILWDNAASTFRSLIPSKRTKASVMIVTTVNPKCYGGQLFLNSTPGTRFYFNHRLESIKEFSQRLSIASEAGFRCVDTNNHL